MAKTKAFAYLRVSGIGQKDGDGFPRQRTAIRKYAEANNLEIVGEFRDTFTGTDDHRPALAEMMVSLEQNHHGVTTVIIERMDRLARKLMVQEAIVANFQTKGFNLLSTAPGEDDLLSDDPTRELIRQFMGMLAQYDKKMTVQKLKAAKDRLRAQGKKADGRYGYRDTEEGRRILATIHALRRKPRTGKCRTWAQVAEELNLRSITTMDGKPWTLHRVYQVAHP